MIMMRLNVMPVMMRVFVQKEIIYILIEKYITGYFD